MDCEQQNDGRNQGCQGQHKGPDKKLKEFTEDMALVTRMAQIDHKIMVLSGKTKLWYLYPVTQVMNLVYVSLVGILGNVLSYEWKGRKISPVKRNTQG